MLETHTYTYTHELIPKYAPSLVQKAPANHSRAGQKKVSSQLETMGVAPALSSARWNRLLEAERTRLRGNCRCDWRQYFLVYIMAAFCVALGMIRHGYMAFMDGRVDAGDDAKSGCPAMTIIHESYNDMLNNWRPPTGWRALTR